MIIRSILLIGFIVTCIISEAQEKKKLVAVVTNSEGLPIDNCSITIKGTRETAVTDNCGKFSMPIGQQKFTMSFNSPYREHEKFEVRIDPIEILSDEKIMFVLNRHEKFEAKCKKITDNRLNMYVVN